MSDGATGPGSTTIRCEDGRIGYNIPKILDNRSGRSDLRGMIWPETIRTERLVLRRPVEADATAIFDGSKALFT